MGRYVKAGNITIYYHLRYGGFVEDFLYPLDQSAGKTLGDDVYVDLGGVQELSPVRRIQSVTTSFMSWNFALPCEIFLADCIAFNRFSIWSL